jgi:hypothetical protein
MDKFQWVHLWVDEELEDKALRVYLLVKEVGEVRRGRILRFTCG